MTRDEFLFEHDVVGISEMLSQITPQDEEKEEDAGEVPAVDFL